MIDLTQDTMMLSIGFVLGAIAYSRRRRYGGIRVVTEAPPSPSAPTSASGTVNARIPPPPSVVDVPPGASPEQVEHVRRQWFDRSEDST
jgi:hypothetical protein